MTTRTEHPVIWLQPWCTGCDLYNDPRLWCQDDVWGKCDECDALPVKYMLAPDQPTPVACDDGVSEDGKNA